MLTPMKNVLLTTAALACLALSGCIIVIEQAPAVKAPVADQAAPIKTTAAKPNPDSSSK